MLFKIFKIRKMVKEVSEDPGNLAKEEIGDFLKGMVLLPFVIAILGIILFFLAGYTDVFGKEIGFFKFLFWLALSVSFGIFFIVRMFIRILSRATEETVREATVILKTTELKKSNDHQGKDMEL